MKYLLIIAFLINSINAGDFDRDIIVKDQTRNEKVRTVFKEMMQNYEEENLDEFFTFVSEDRFNQDYMTFYEAIEKDIRIYDILRIETWINKITEDGVKRYLYVRWDKRYEDMNGNDEVAQKGYSRFLFDEVNGKYKLIELAGNNFWGQSLQEWTEEVPQIAGQEVYAKGETNTLPDFIITNISCTQSPETLHFDIEDISGSLYAGSVEWEANGDGNTETGSNSVGNVSVMTTVCPLSSGSVTVEADPLDNITESDETNNITTETF